MGVMNLYVPRELRMSLLISPTYSWCFGPPGAVSRVSRPAQHAPTVIPLWQGQATLAQRVLAPSSCLHLMLIFSSQTCIPVGYLHAESGTNRNILGIKSVGIGVNKTGASRVAAP